MTISALSDPLDVEILMHYYYMYSSAVAGDVADYRDASFNYQNRDASVLRLVRAGLLITNQFVTPKSLYTIHQDSYVALERFRLSLYQSSTSAIRTNTASFLEVWILLHYNPEKTDFNEACFGGRCDVTNQPVIEAFKQLLYNDLLTGKPDDGDLLFKCTKEAKRKIKKLFEDLSVPFEY